ncbi:hypothetical protein Tsubulata_017413, partial [Turnera subulata]
AHIECVTSQEDPWINCSPMVSDDPGAEAMKQIQQQSPASVVFDEVKRKPQCQRQIQIEDFSNYHRLAIHRHGDDNPYLRIVCDACNVRVRYSSYYTCEFCNLHYHKLCAELPRKIRHTLHPPHLLSLYASDSWSDPIFCCGCLNVSLDGGYKCRECLFELDLKCASSLTAQQLQNSENKKNTIFCSIHDHKLTPVSCENSRKFTCHACTFPILGTAYGCFRCHIIFHETCSDIPKNRQHLYHPQHSLVAKESTIPSQCKACNYPILLGIKYACRECTAFAIHAKCAEYITSTFKSSCHGHILFSFAKKEYPKFNYGGECYFECKVCGKECSSSFYRCLECDMNFHLDCIPLPKKVIKHNWHSHTLTLVDSMREDDSGEYYCEICCGQRNPNHGAYYCEECKDQHGVLVIAHIGCVLEEEDDSLEILSWTEG